MFFQKKLKGVEKKIDIFICCAMTSKKLSTLRWNMLILWGLLIAVLLIVNVFFSIFEKINASDYPWRGQDDFFVSKTDLLMYEDNKERFSDIRNSIIDHMVSLSFTWFVSRPYETFDAEYWIQLSGGYLWELFVEPISVQDDLDEFISNFFSEFDETNYIVNKKPFHLSEVQLLNWTGVFYYKNQHDLEKRWYDVLSHRTRINTDKEYRRHNISTALNELWTPLLLFPWDQIDFLTAIWYDPAKRELYKDWFVVVQDEEQPSYGGWLCWASTALYQWILTNQWLWLPERRAHTKWYTSLYQANINGDNITIPWLDSTVYDGHVDLKIKNISTEPVILIATYDGSHWWKEEVFTLWPNQYAWNIEHAHSRPNSSTIIVDGEPIPVSWWCYVWKVNGQERKSCYKEVKY